MLREKDFEACNRKVLFGLMGVDKSGLLVMGEHFR